ncbi:MAG: GIY-YIG nuclease family protein [Candidatus Sungbacteria bacterium]|nr:GIY-YIG nuclease family protein [Candidatus Sungbacteria bacterium]
MKAYVYILANNSGKFYVGSTNDIARRLHQHKVGHTQTTSNMKMERLVLYQEYKSLAQARKVEMRIKKMKRKDYIEKMIRDGYIAMK